MGEETVTPEEAARQLRRTVIEMSHRAKSAHLGSALSCADILAALYFGGVLRHDPLIPDDPGRDRFVMSKGHAATALYAILAMRGYFSASLLETFCEPGGVLTEHPPARLLAGVEAATGSLGHGLPIAVGMALAARLTGAWRVFCLVGDGEAQEGSIWEAALLGGAERLSCLTVIVDANGAQGIDYVGARCRGLAERWHAFGWQVSEIDGHRMPALLCSLNYRSEKPHAIIAYTRKGSGVSFMEADPVLWHYRPPDGDEFAKAMAELV